MKYSRLKVAFKTLALTLGCMGTWILFYHAASAAVSIWQLLPAPTGLVSTCAIAGDAVTLTWNPVATAQNYYLRIDNLSNNPADSAGWYVDASSEYSLDGYSGTTFTGKITPNTNYKWWVHAANGSGIGSLASGVFVCAPPTAATMTITLAWDKNPEPSVTGYNLYRRQDTTTPVKLNAAPILTPQYADGTAVIGQTYIYTVRAVSTGGEESGDSNELRTVASVQPGSVTNLVAVIPPANRDTIPPTITRVTYLGVPLTAGSTQVLSSSAASMSLVVTASDNQGILSIQWLVDGIVVAHQGALGKLPPSIALTWNDAIPAGTHAAVIKASDGSQNAATFSFVIRK